MSGYKVEQRRVTYRGRQFHFVSYDAQDANAARKQLAMAPTWFLMMAGKRWEVAPHLVGQAPEELEGLLTQWLEEHAFC